MRNAECGMRNRGDEGLRDGDVQAPLAIPHSALRIPHLSVVIASVNGYPWLAQCLLSLERQTARERMEVLVVDRLGDGTAEQVAADFPGVRVVRAACDRSVPQLRGQGLRLARGEVVAITEDHVVASLGWEAAILDAQESY